MTTLLDIADVSKLFPAAGGPGTVGADQASLRRAARQIFPTCMPSTT